MKKLHLQLTIGLIWIVLILNAIFEYDFFVESYKGSNTTRDCTDGGAITGMTCRATLFLSNAMSALFWGIFSSVLLWNLVPIDSDDEE